VKTKIATPKRDCKSKDKFATRRREWWKWQVRIRRRLDKASREEGDELSGEHSVLQGGNVEVEFSERHRGTCYGAGARSENRTSHRRPPPELDATSTISVPSPRIVPPSTPLTRHAAASAIAAQETRACPLRVAPLVRLPSAIIVRMRNHPSKPPSTPPRGWPKLRASHRPLIIGGFRSSLRLIED
jgi:hypothetical protein